MTRIALHTLGCKLNYAETSTYERGFAAAGWEIVPWGQPAEVYLLNTCAVTQHAEKKSRNLIRAAASRHPETRIVVTGCYAELRAAEIAALPGVSRVFRATEKSLVVPETLAFAAPSTKQGTFVDGVLPAWSGGERTRSFLKVQDGCDNFCAYCTVPFARGRSRNLPISDLVVQAHDIAATGIKEIVLTGVNTGDFGRTTGESFLDLLKALNEVEGIERYRISSIEPNLITEEIIDWIASGTKFLPHFHIPLQTGSDALLKAVGRRYDTKLFAERIDYIRERIPHVFFGIDVIVGLPGETDELFEETFRFLQERIRPAFIHIFPYSRRPGTRAYNMPCQVQDSIKTARVERLEALSDELHAEFVASCKGLPEKVLWECVDRDGMMEGYTGNYIRITKPFDPEKVGTIEDITI